MLKAAALLVAAAVLAAPRVHFPRDHFAHPSAGIEWWYFTGVVAGSDGHRYSVFFTLFSRGGFVLPVSQVVDLDTGELVGHTETPAQAALGTKSLDVVTPGGSLAYRGNAWRFSAADGAGYGLSVTAVPQKRYVLHGGGTGVIRQSTAGTSFYYSATRMRATGTITRAGAPLAVSGTAWFDHQWGNFVNDPAAFDWDWFSCRFDDRTELMLYGFRDRAGNRIAANRSGTFVLRDGRSRLVRAFDLVPGARTLDAGGRSWPLDWQLTVPSERLTLQLTSIVPDQLVRGTLLPTFWEGAATATGSKTGTCFVEQSYG